MTAALRRLLASDELEGDLRARLACAALLLYFCHSLGAWQLANGAALSTYGTDNWNVLPSWLVAAAGGPFLPPPAWTPVHLSLLYFCGLLGLLHLFRKDCLISLLALAFLFVNKTYFYLSDLRLATDVDHIHLFLSLLFLISRRKLFFLRLGLVAAYLLLAFAKLSPSWLGAEFFLSTSGTIRAAAGAQWALPWFCPLWVAWEFLGPLLWFSRGKLARDAATAVFALAHAFYAAVGGLDYPLFMIPLLLAAAWDSGEPFHDGCRFSKSDAAAWACLGLFLLGGTWHFLLPGDLRLGGEGKLLSLLQSDVNKAGGCRVVVEKGSKRTVLEMQWPWRLPTRQDDGTQTAAGVPQYKGEFFENGRLKARLPWRAIVRDGSQIVWNPYPFLTLPYEALDPYVFYLYGTRLCREYKPDRLSVRLDLQLDGHLERARVLDIPDFCGLNPSYLPFRHNDWIRVARSARPR